MNIGTSDIGTSAKRQRKSVKVFLELQHPRDLALLLQIELLKRQRRFTSVVRDGIRLICDLQRGSYDILFELFPAARADYANAQALNDMRDEVIRLRQQLNSGVGSAREYAVSADVAPYTPETREEMPSGADMFKNMFGEDWE